MIKSVHEIEELNLRSFSSFETTKNNCLISQHFCKPFGYSAHLIKIYTILIFIAYASIQ